MPRRKKDSSSSPSSSPSTSSKPVMKYDRSPKYDMGPSYNAGPDYEALPGDMGLGGPGTRGLIGMHMFTSYDGSEDHWRDVHWVYNNLWIDGVEAGDAPSPGAWFWLMQCRSSQKALEDFRSYYMKLAPSRKELDERARRRDGGEGVIELLNQVEEVLDGGR